MAENRVCKECNAKQDEGAKFPKYGRICASCLSKREKQRYDEKRDAILEQRKQHHSENREQINARQREYAAQYYEDNKQAILEQRRQEYSEEHPPRPCIDCGEPIPKRAVKYCAACREMHDEITVRQALRKYRKKQE
jgi:hypothetical protein